MTELVEAKFSVRIVKSVSENESSIEINEFNFLCFKILNLGALTLKDSNDFDGA